MKNSFAIIPLLAVLLAPTAVQAGGEEAQAREEERVMQERQSMLEEAERAREEAQSARREAVRAAEMARETARMHEREASEQSRDLQEETARERALQQEELARAREELSRAHRELREATREVARAHRDLARADRVPRPARPVNLGDRAVIGIVLGSQSEQGVQIIGVSPDGPAERAGLEQGDILVSIQGVDLQDNDEARQSVFEVMGDVGDGEELAVKVSRDGEIGEYTVVAEQREPRAWQSVIRIPEVEIIESVPGEPQIVVETIEVPEIDEEALAAQMAELTERLKAWKYEHSFGEGEEERHYEFHFDTADFSEFGRHAMSEASIWFGLPHAHGLQLAPINEGLGSYFKTDRGVLVIQAREDNAYRLESGDVVLSIDSAEVDSPGDLMRALRDADPGSEIDISIMRNRKNVSYSVVMPENRLGHR